MRHETVAMLRCPSGCEAPLRVLIYEGTDERIVSGDLICAVCAQTYGIEAGITRMLPVTLTEPEKAADRIEVEKKQSEMAARDAQVEDYDRMRGLALFGKLEIPVTLNRLDLRPTDILLEAGCGTGRMTPTFATRCQSQVAVDFSLESLRVCRRKLQAAGILNVDLIQADVCALPFQSGQFSRVVSCQVLEHIPTPESRSHMVSELARVAQSGGTVVLSAYRHSLYTRLFDKKEGMHTGGIYYYRFHRRELRALLERSLEVQGLTGALVYHYLARCCKP